MKTCLVSVARRSTDVNAFTSMCFGPFDSMTHFEFYVRTIVLVPPYLSYHLVVASDQKWKFYASRVAVIITIITMFNKEISPISYLYLDIG